MNKKVMAVAVAGALALPAAAMAQVTISGGFRMSLSQHSITGTTPAGAVANAATGRINAAGGTSNTSEMRFSDNVSQIIFQAREDLGGGLTAIGRYEWRPTLDGTNAASGTIANGTGNATNFIGLESRTMGTVRIGSVTVYSGAGGTGSTYTSDRGLAFAGHVGISQQLGSGAIVFAGQNAALQQANFGQGRHNNVVVWNSPNWNGFNLAAGFSTNNAGSDGDLAVPAVGATGSPRKGSAIVLAPGYASGPFSMQYIYFDNKVDGLVANATAGAAWVGAGSAGAGAANGLGGALSGAGGTIASRDFKAHKLWGTYNFTNGFSLTGIWSRATLTNAYTGALAQTNANGGNKLSEKTIWQLGGKYATGPHTFTLDYTRAGDDKVVTNAAGQTGGTGAKQWSAGWMYELSKRTEVGLSYTKVTNDAFAANGPQDTANNALGATGTQFNNAGEGYTIWGGNITHKF